MPTHRNHSVAALIAVALLVLFAARARAEDVWVKAPKIDVRSGKSVVYPALGSVTKGTKLSVLGHEGKWIKVSINGQEGYVFGDYTSPSEVGSGSGLAGVLNGSDTSGMSAANAGKGLLEQDVKTYANTKSLDTTGLVRMAAQRNSIRPEDFEKFCAEGRVGPDKPQ